MKRKPAHIGQVAVLLLSVASPAAGAGAPSDETPALLSPAPVEEKDRDAYRKRLQTLTRRRSYFDLFGTAMFGDGLRFNNPYRLSHELGDGGASLSSTAPYLDLALGVTTGNPNGLQHGARLGWSVSVIGVPQQVITPAYLALVRFAPSWLAYGWAGLPVLIEPDANLGGELAVGASWLARAGLGASFALVADAFYGAGTAEARSAFYPVLSAQLGLFVGYEVLP